MDRSLMSIVMLCWFALVSGCEVKGPVSTVGDGGTNPNPELPVAHLTPLFTSEALPGCTYASPIAARSQGSDVIIVIDKHGKLVGLDPSTGAPVFSFSFPSSVQENTVELLSTPAVIDGNRLVVGYQELVGTDFLQRANHKVVVFDLDTRALDASFAPIVLSASVPAHDGTGQVQFLSRWQLMRAAIRTMKVPDRDLGLAYVSLGNGPSWQPFHGWMFEVDLDAWKRGEAAVTGTLVSTAENGCGPANGQDPSVCGGGIWNAAGPQFYSEADGSYRLLFATGNGRVDYDIRAFAHSVLRVGRGLSFDPGCDPNLCKSFDERDPSRACLASCTNIFTPRLGDGEGPLTPEDGSCDGKTFFECYGVLDADLGATSPVVINVPGGPRTVLQGGKDGAAYLVDLEHLGTMYQRLQIMDFCGTKTDPCVFGWIGSFVTHPAVTELEGEAIAILPSVKADHTHPAGINAVGISMQDGLPHMRVRWQVPDFASSEARTGFRDHPGRPIIASVGGEPYVFVVETRRGFIAPPPGRLWVVRVRDGYVAAKLPLVSAGQRFTMPLIRDDVIYVNTCDNQAESGGQLQAFRVAAR